MIDILSPNFRYFRAEKGTEAVCIKTFVGWEARFYTSRDPPSIVLFTLGQDSLKIKRVIDTRITDERYA